MTTRAESTAGLSDLLFVAITLKGALVGLWERNERENFDSDPGGFM